MTTVQRTLTPGYGQRHHDLLHYSQAIRVGDRVETSGQGGWDAQTQVPTDLTAEIVQAFDNVEATLVTAGATWRDVVSVTSYHRAETGVIGEADNAVMVEQLRTRTGDRAPIWTQVGVTAFGLATMRVEIAVTAYVGSGS